MEHQLPSIDMAVSKKKGHRPHILQKKKKKGHRAHVLMKWAKGPITSEHEDDDLYFFLLETAISIDGN